MIQLDVYSIRRMVRKALDMTGHREPKYLVKFVICGIHSVIIVLLFSVCECVCVCVCSHACMHPFLGGNVEFNKNEEMQLY
jgi:hypothetical protein